MRSLRLTEKELLNMKQFYENELEDTMNKLQHIKKVLKKLGAVVPDIDVSTKGTGQTKLSKRGRKSKWGAFVKDKLKETQTPMTYEQLVDVAMKEFKIQESKRANTRQAIISSAYRLRNLYGELKTFAMKGSRIKFVALPDWFNTNGRIKNEFSSRIKEIPQPVFQEGKRPGRPPKKKKEAAPAPKSSAKTTGKSKRGRKPSTRAKSASKKS
jgi:hypothetical protein